MVVQPQTMWIYLHDNCSVGRHVDSSAARETQIVSFHFIEAPDLCLNALHDKWQQIEAVCKPERMKVVAKECGLMVIHLVNVGKNE